ncbi:MAG: ribosomal L7Ae/L30e/S12e/Gadd45 family protein [Firmicutes bacterium]|nr:ribosomal L7Ae/L30e/S12e/Gadd45 family protein [Bacillota bacterium]
MDTKKESRIPQCGDMPDLTVSHVVVGAKQLKKAVNAGRARAVFLAENADPAVTQPLWELCRLHEVPVSWVRSMAELGRSCGIEVGAAAAAVLD